MTNEYVGQQALDALSDRVALLDGSLRALELKVGDPYGYEVSVRLECKPCPSSPVALTRIHLSGVTRFDVDWRRADGDFYIVAGYSAFVVGDGSVYLSLDPFDEHLNAPDARDCMVIEATSIRIELLPEGPSLAS